jgi:maleylacetoacetate isomerase
MKLHGYFRSSAAFRVRIALNLKGLSYEQVFIHLRKGEQSAPDFLRVNPQGLVPALEDDGVVLTQSMAIVEYLDETYPEPPLLPRTPMERARVRAIAQAIACDIHPIDNLRVLNYLKNVLKVTTEQHDAWYNHWIVEGFTGVEALLAQPGTGKFCHGDTPGLADICLVPQVFNGKRLNAPLERFPRVMKVFGACMALDAFKTAAPENQPDKE